jgi:hypothetical protein
VGSHLSQESRTIHQLLDNLGFGVDSYEGTHNLDWLDTPWKTKLASVLNANQSSNWCGGQVTIKKSSSANKQKKLLKSNRQAARESQQASARNTNSVRINLFSISLTLFSFSAQTFGANALTLKAPFGTFSLLLQRHPLQL